MIIDSYCSERESLFSPEAFLGDKKEICDIAIATFSYEIAEAALKMYPHKTVAHCASANGRKPIYMLDVNGRNVIFYMSSIGSACASGDVIEMQWQTGVRKLIIFGSAGSLDSDSTTGKYVVPSSAYRDEGMSYHYAPPSDFIGIKNCGVVADFFKRHDLPYVVGKNWTTDAPYRETRSAVNKMKELGCISVEMELAGLQAVCSFYDIDLYSFLVTGDVLDGEEYAPEGLNEANHSLNKFFLALEIAKEI